MQIRVEIDTVSGGDLQIGRNHSGDKNHLKGKMDNIRIYNRSLSSTEVAELHEMEKPKTGLEKGLVAYYPFNGSASDESGNDTKMSLLVMTMMTPSNTSC